MTIAPNDIIFFTIALIASILYASKCKEIWFPNTSNNEGLSVSRYIHEIWFNFIGSFVGWISLYIVYKSLYNFSWENLVINIGWQHLIMFMLGILGITGLLPYTLWGLSRSADFIVNKMITHK